LHKWTLGVFFKIKTSPDNQTGQHPTTRNAPPPPPTPTHHRNQQHLSFTTDSTVRMACVIIWLKKYANVFTCAQFTRKYVKISIILQINLKGKTVFRECHVRKGRDIVLLDGVRASWPIREQLGWEVIRGGYLRREQHMSYLKGQCHEVILTRFFSSITSFLSY
jgi:hypothetical protein